MVIKRNKNGHENIEFYEYYHISFYKIANYNYIYYSNILSIIFYIIYLFKIYNIIWNNFVMFIYNL
jgi:hypothetical protein